MAIFKLMTPFKAIPFLCAAALLTAETPQGWKVIKDPSGACQLAVPGDWEINRQLTSLATAPDKSDATIVSQPGKTVKPMIDMVQKTLGVDKMIENTPQRVLWAGKATSLPGLSAAVPYHVTVAGKAGTCVGQITVPKGVSEELVKKIAYTVSGTK